MDCLRSFNFSIDLIVNIPVGVQLKQWITGGQHFWQAATIGTSRYNIEGFKNINVYGIDVIGTIETQTNIVGGAALVNDWSVDVTLGGQQPLVGGNILGAPNYYALDISNPSNNIYALSKYSNSLRFASPYESVKFIELGQTMAQGFGYETVGFIILRWDLNFVVYYKFEGE